MNDDIFSTFVRDFLYHDPACTITVQSLVERFKGRLLPSERRRWTRKLIVARLVEMGYAVGKRSDKRLAVAGLSLDLPRKWITVGGRLRRVEPAA